LFPRITLPTNCNALIDMANLKPPLEDNFFRLHHSLFIAHSSCPLGSHVSATPGILLFKPVYNCGSKPLRRMLQS